MAKRVRIGLIGAGAFGEKHLDALQHIQEADIRLVVGALESEARQLADKFGISEISTSFEDVISRDDIDAVILATPTPMHARQAIAAMKAGKHVEVEIPLADSLEDAEEVLTTQAETGLVCMVGHTRRFNPSHQWIKHNIESGEFTIQSLVVETFFFRRRNINAKGEPRSWTDHLLWHHAAHTIDLFQYMTGSPIVAANILEGPKHRELGIAMDQSIQMRTEAGQILTLALSFNNDGPLGTVFRYIGDSGTYIARYDDLVTGNNEAIDLSKVATSSNGIELQDREFITAILDKREPNSSVAKVIECYRTIGALAASLEE